ncbi:hypothetical protein NF867_02265 [Solitalea sp. MAHUQ-68]|uniref:DUF916 domain-containing protein n=1 Tax=Solitalea agri TaxID=2953739 RepID=A0A9X2JCD7_9SPHI|nr:hypothetical protein [Solitalea agri]MCO4291685.1 hypothetical protein [Solitalea agri]
MKQINHLTGLIALVLGLTTIMANAQDKTQKGTIQIYLAYSQLNNDLPVIKVSAKTKKEQKFEPVAGVDINLFFNSETTAGFMGRVNTNNLGNGSLAMPIRFKSQFDTSASLKFIGTVTQNKQFKDQSTELEIAKAKIELTLDEVDSVRSIHAKVLALQPDGQWAPVPETEIKLVVRRLLSDLTATEEETYTTDSIGGEVSADFNMSVPGDSKGNIVVGAKIDENELYGTLVAAKTVKWGTPLVPDHSFSERSLWATRDKTPLWLLIFPNIIIITVWGIIFYLIYQITKLIKLGKENSSV